MGEFGLGYICQGKVDPGSVLCLDFFDNAPDGLAENTICSGPVILEDLGELAGDYLAGGVIFTRLAIDEMYSVNLSDESILRLVTENDPCDIEADALGQLEPVRLEFLLWLGVAEILHAGTPPTKPVL